MPAIVGPGDKIAYPPVTSQLDFEIELVAVVARPLGEEAQASACLLGYTIGNDISARDAGKKLGVLDVFTQKALDRTAPIGPWITTLAPISISFSCRLDQRPRFRRLGQRQRAHEIAQVLGWHMEFGGERRWR